MSVRFLINVLMLFLQCLFSPGHGWARGAYVCQCRKGFYAATGNPLFNGSLVETAWKEKFLFGRYEPRPFLESHSEKEEFS